MNLRNVPDDEADGVRQMLDELGVEWYELPPTAFGLSAGSLWIRHNEDHPRVQDAFARFQVDYTERARRSARPGPIDARKLTGALIVAAIILGFMFWPVLQLMR